MPVRHEQGSYPMYCGVRLRNVYCFQNLFIRCYGLPTSNLVKFHTINFGIGHLNLNGSDFHGLIIGAAMFYKVRYIE